MVAFMFHTARRTSQDISPQKTKAQRLSMMRKPTRRVSLGSTSEYMEMLQEEDPTKYEAHFSKFIAAGIDADKMEDMYTDAHAKIRENPDGESKDKKSVSYTRKGNTASCSDGTEHVRTMKLSLKQRKAKVAAKIAAAQAKMLAGED